MDFIEEISQMNNAHVAINTCIRIVNITATGMYSFQLSNNQINNYQVFGSAKEVLKNINAFNEPLIIHIQSQNSTFIPNKLVSEKNVENLINYVPLIENQKVYNYYLKKLDIISVFSAFHEELINSIHESKPEALIFDQLSAFMEPLNLANMGLHLHFDQKGFVAVMIQNDKLYFAKYFICNNINEIQYYLNLIFKELHLNIKKPTIFSSGQNSNLENILKTLKNKYLVQEHTNSEYQFKIEISENHIKNEIAYLSDIYRCVLLEEN